jgi:uncharacterized protein (TIGR02285 family)
MPRHLLLLACLLAPAIVQAEALEILYETRSPYVIPAADGLAGLVGAPLTTALRQADIATDYAEVPSTRILREIEANLRPLCSPGWFMNPERQAFAKFSRPLYQDQPTAIVSRTDNAAIRDGMTLDDLLGQPDLVVLAKMAYSYGQVIDEQLARHGTHQRRVGVDNVTLLSMIAKKRADFLFIGPEEAQDLLREHPDREQLRLSTLSGMPAGNKRYLMCSRQVADALIHRIDQQLK